MDLILFHGTDSDTAQLLLTNQINVSLGGGELGRGFYLGDLKHQAFIWAYKRFPKKYAVVQFTLNEDDIIDEQKFKLLLIPSFVEAQKYSHLIKHQGITRLFLFRVDIVWSPVVGIRYDGFNQFKFESSKSETYLNQTTIIKLLI